MILMFDDDAVVPKGDHPGDGLIEHMRQHDVIKTADWVIDLGPGGGVNGGRIIAEGVPEVVAAVKQSATGAYLRPILERASVKPKVVESKPRKPARSSRAKSRGAKSRDVNEELNLEAAK